MVSGLKAGKFPHQHCALCSVSAASKAGMMLGWLPVRDGAQAERVGHRAVSFWLHLLAWWHQKNLKLILWKTTTALLIGMALVGWAFYSFFTVMLHLLQGLHQQ